MQIIQSRFCAVRTNRISNIPIPLHVLLVTTSDKNMTRTENECNCSQDGPKLNTFKSEVIQSCPGAVYKDTAGYIYDILSFIHNVFILLTAAYCSAGVLFFNKSQAHFRSPL